MRSFKYQIFIYTVKKYAYLAFLAFVLHSSNLLFSNEEVLIFYHIPKTAGTTINFLLNQQFEKNLICPDNFYYELESRPIDYLRQFKFFRGHFFFNSNLQLLENAKKIVFLRDPIQRVLSEQKFFQIRYGPTKQYRLYREHYLPEGQPIETMSNHQCLFLSSLDRSDPSITAEMHFASAKENLLNEFFFVGITERIEESVGVLYKLMGWQIPDTIPRLMATHWGLDYVNDQILEEIRQRNLLDIQLYELAKDLFNSRLQQMEID